MKRILSFLGLLCLFLKVAGQENIGDKGVRVGALVPDVTVRGASGVRVDGKDLGGEFRLSALRGRLVILDYWATWCSPCRRMVPILDSLQRVFGDKVLFLPVAYEKAAVVAPILAQLQRMRPFNLPGVTGDVVLNGLFPHRSLPHYAWIGADGVVKAITEEGAVTGENIAAVIGGKAISLAEKKDIVTPYDKNQPLLLNGNGGNGTVMVYHSILTGYLPGLIAGTDITRADSTGGLRYNLRNVPLVWLYRIAWSDKRWFGNARMRLLTADSSKMRTSLSGEAFEQWLGQGNGWCYELQVPGRLAGKGYAMMQEDVGRLFPGYVATVEKVRTRCLALLRTSGIDKLRSGGGGLKVEVGAFNAELRNCPLSQLLTRLEVQFLQNSPLPLADLSGYTGKVDLSLHGPMSRVADLNKELARYDLAFVEKDATVEMLVIRDAVVN